MSFHLVGTIPLLLQTKISAEPKFKCHGRLTSKEIHSLAIQCSLGLSSFALDRKRMNEACALKVREYLALGLPVYGNYKESFSPDFPYYRQGEPTIEAILSFAQEISPVRRQKVKEESIPHIDKTLLLKRLYLSLQAKFSM